MAIRRSCGANIFVAMLSDNKILVLDGGTPLPVPVCVPVSWNTAAGADTGTGEDDQVFLGDEKVLQQFPRIIVYRSVRL